MKKLIYTVVLAFVTFVSQAQQSENYSNASQSFSQDVAFSSGASYALNPVMEELTSSFSADLQNNYLVLSLRNSTVPFTLFIQADNGESIYDKAINPNASVVFNLNNFEGLHSLIIKAVDQRTGSISVYKLELLKGTL